MNILADDFICPACFARVEWGAPGTVEMRTLITVGRKRLGLSVTVFALALGVTRGAVQQWERPDGTAPKRSRMGRIAALLSISAGELQFGGPPDRPLISSRQRVRVISEVEAGGFSNIDNFADGKPFETVAVTVEVKRHTFALKVHGNSMCSPIGESFPEGTLIVVEPEMTAEPGDYVIALNHNDQGTFKQLLLRDGVLYLHPLNKRFKPVPLGTSKIIGVVREAIRRFR